MPSSLCTPTASRAPPFQLAGLDGDPAYQAMSDREKTIAALERLGIDPSNYKVGQTRLFLSVGILDGLRQKRTEEQVGLLA